MSAQCLDGRIQPAEMGVMAPFPAAELARYCTGHKDGVDAGWK